MAQLSGSGAAGADALDNAAEHNKGANLLKRLGPTEYKRIAIGAAIAVALFFLVQTLGTAYFKSHFAPGTKVGGIDASWMTVEQLAETAKGRLETYSDHIEGDGLDLTVTAKDLGLTINEQEWAQAAFDETDPGSWFSSMLSGTTIEPKVGTSVNEELALEAVSSAVEKANEGSEPPTDAVVTYDEETNSFVVEPEVLGTEVSASRVAATLANDAKLLRESTTLGENELARPAFSTDSESFNQAVQRANDMLKLSYTLTLDGNEIPYPAVDGKITHDWIRFIKTDDGGVAVTLDEQKSIDWCYDNLNAVVNGENEVRTWEVSSPETAAILRASMEAGQYGKTEVATITMAERPPESEGARERGRHIDVNLSTQYARLYDEDGTVLWRSYIVSGDASWGNDTPVGEFEINEMGQNVMMTGLNNGYTAEDAETNPDAMYHTLANYWMAFTPDGSDGLHDAWWRWDSEFGGDTYLWNGSHGCINLPLDKAAELYGLVHIGDPVIVHY